MFMLVLLYGILGFGSLLAFSKKLIKLFFTYAVGKFY